jgi:hypothetical protein
MASIRTPSRLVTKELTVGVKVSRRVTREVGQNRGDEHYVLDQSPFSRGLVPVVADVVANTWQATVFLIKYLSFFKLQIVIYPTITSLILTRKPP